PAPGRITLLDFADGPGVRIDTGFASGDAIPADFDSMIAKIIAFGRDRVEALARLRRAVADTTVIIEGGTSNKSFVLDLLNEPAVIEATADTGWIDRTRAEGGLVSHQHAGIALVAAAIEANEVEEQAERSHFFATAHGGRPQARHQATRAIDLTLRGASHRVTVSQLGPNRYRVGVAAGGSEGEVRTVDARLERLNGHASRLEVGDQRYRLVTATHGPVNLVEVNGVTHRVSRDEGGVLRAPAPALVVAVPVAVGDEVPAGAPVLVLESMKMETVLPAPFPARVRELLVGTGGQVEAGTPLVRLEPLADQDAAAEDPGPQAGAPRLELPAERDATAADRAAACLADLRSLLLGFDLGEDEAASTLAAYQRYRAELAAAGRSEILAELAVFRAFADLCELARNRPGGEEPHNGRMHSPREYFHSYLHSLDVEREQLPEDFRRRLSQALTHYGVTELDRTPALEEAVYRIFLAAPGAPSHQRLVSALLQQWLLDDAPGEDTAEEVRDVLERLVAATQLRYPVVGDLARSVRFRWFDQPLVDAVRASVLAGVRDEVHYLADNPDAADYARRINDLAAIPERIVRFLAERLEAGIGEHEPMLEVLARRHYREYELHGLRNLRAADRPVVVCDYTLDARPTHLVTTVAELSELVPGSALVTALEQQLEQAPAGSQAVFDLYVRWPELPDAPAEASAQLNAILSKLDVMHRVRRVVTAICPGGDRPVSYYTFRPDSGEGGLVEDDLVRGVHPMVGRRLQLRRLQNFTITRLDAPEDVLLYLLVAPDNPADRRLVALAQIREFAVVRDAEGRVVSLPHAERAVASCGEAIRRARATLGGGRLDMNYVALHIWPTVDAPVSELTDLQRTISPLTVGAGIEEVIAEGNVVAPDGIARYTVVRFSYQPGAGVVTSVTGRMTEWLQPLDDYAQKVLRARRRGLVYPYELVGMLTGRDGRFTELDLDENGRLAPVQRPPGGNKASIVVGVASTPTERHPQGITRVVLLGDPTRSLGSLAEPECARVVAALDLAEELSVPVEWFTLSSGARISMQSGTENMDWVAAALKRIVEFTQAGGEINIVVNGINVGAQPYW
ncbi:MAG: fused acetyl/propionyl-CoA carboxylase subunit alpha/methylmalonyl-CoA decarboxylase subunit alpha, partial [Actinobacteria bacterium]|nr:fused acetyl/propionyl-CoA carboxylase subunit alpha/methylmalonyl-CoA decarboxylase subunit alpha [Actinomycetota bacterium]